jgi:hypothetical protein
VLLSEGERLPLRGIAPDDTASSTLAALACTSQHVDHCVA